MTSEGLESALEFIRDAVAMLSDPAVVARLKTLQAENAGALEWAARFEPVEGSEKMPKRGTCPNCGRRYVFVGEQGGIRRHGKGRCFVDTNAASEIIPAILVIAELSDNTEGTGDDGTRNVEKSDHI